MRKLHAGFQAAHGAGRIELGGGAGQQFQLLAAIGGIAGLVEDGGAGGRDLVAADHDGVGELGRHGLGLGLRQPESPATGRFPVPLDLVHGRIAGGEVQAEALQQAGAIAGGGGQDQRTGRRIGAHKNNGLELLLF